MKTEWQLQEAKARFSEVVERAIQGVPQTVTRRGRPAVMVVSVEEYERQRAATRPRKSLVKLLRECPEPGLADILDESREAPDYGRDIDLG